MAWLWGAIAVGLTWCTGWALVGACWPWRTSDLREVALRGALSLVVGAAAQSLVTFVVALLHMGTRGGLLFGEVALLGVAMALHRRGKRTRLATAGFAPRLHLPPGHALGCLWRPLMGVGGLGLLLAMLLGMVLAGVCWAHTNAILPNGAWDAWMTFNLKARFIVRSPEDWPHFFSEFIAWSHPDYPLLLPLVVARLWIYLGSEAPLAPAVVSLAAMLLLVLTLASGVARLRGPILGPLAGLALLSTMRFVLDAPVQLADAPLALCFLSAAVVLSLALAGPVPQPRLLALSGLLLGFAAWTKNEGVVMSAGLLLGAGAAAALWRGGEPHLTKPAEPGDAPPPAPAAARDTTRDRLLRALHVCRWMVAGMIVPGFFVVLIKLVFAYRSHLVAGQTLGMLAKRAAIGDRHEMILLASLQTFLGWVGPPLLLVLLLAAVALGIDARSAARRGAVAAAAALLVTMSGYYVVFLVTPHDLVLYLREGLARLILQVWPTMLWVFFALVGAPAALLARRVEPLGREVSPSGRIVVESQSGPPRE